MRIKSLKDFIHRVILNAGLHFGYFLYMNKTDFFP